MLFSVVIPLYNKALSIQSTLDSVLSQIYTKYEIIVIDDGSTDESAQKVLEIKDTRIRLIKKKNGGVSSARNEGILAAQGEYIAFLDGDDLWHPTYLETLYQLIQDYPNRSIYGIGCAKIHNEEIPLLDNEVLNCYRGIADWDYSKMFFTGSSTCAPREKLIAIGLFDTRMKYGEDMDMWFRLLLNGGGACDGRPLAYYRQDTENRAMHKVIPLEVHIPFFMDDYEDYRKSNDSFRHFFDQEMVYRLYPYLFSGKYKSQAKEIAKKIDYAPLKFSMRFRMMYPYLYKIYMYTRNLWSR
jgi:glycosyltransferase involved in cell wall biosynthesis